MKHSSTLSPSPRRSPRRRQHGCRAVAWLLGVALLGAAGCVTQGRHSALSDSHESLKMQNRQLGERVQRLETSNEILDAERVALSEDLEEDGGAVVLVELSPEVESVFKILDLEEVLTVATSVDEAMTRLRMLGKNDGEELRRSA